MTIEEKAMDRFVLTSGLALMVGGVLAAALNAVLTPMLPATQGTVAVATSAAYGIRMPLAAASIALVTWGCVGLYLAQAHRLRFGKTVFLLAGAGGFMVFWAELVQATLVRDLAFAVPEALEAAESAGELARYDLVFPIGVGLFTLGWLGIAVVTLRAGVLGRRGATTLLAGAILVPLLGAIFGVLGAVAGNVVLGGGWALMGSDLRQAVAEKPG